MREFVCESDTERAIVKNIVLQNKKAVARAVWKNEEMKEQVFLEVLGAVKTEVKHYAKDPECLLKVIDPAVVTSFNNEAFYAQLQDKCPSLCLIFANLVKPGKAKLYSQEELHGFDHRKRNAICFAAASCLKQYNQKLSAAHYRLSLLLLNGGAKSITIDRCTQLAITVCHSSSTKMQTKAGETSSKCVSWKEDTIKKVLKIRFLEDIIGRCDSDMTSVDMSRDSVSHSKYFQEETYDDLLEFVRGVKVQREGVATPTMPAALTKKDLEAAIKELRKSITHYKYVKKIVL